MRIGLQIPSFTWPGGPGAIRSQLADIARAAEDAGFASVWVMDHFFQIPVVGPAEQEMLEGWSTLAYLAAVTERVKLGTLVTGVTYRNPGVLAKTATTLDVLSGGRAYCGIGAAWFDREHRGLGVAFPPLAERFERLEETLRILHQFWSGEAARFDGRHYQLAETLNSPPALTRPHPPILIGGMGEKKTLRLVAQYADACNLFTYQGPELVAHKLDVLRRHCDAVGRDYGAIEKTTLGTVELAKRSAADFVDEARRLAKVGVQHAIVNFPDVHELAPLRSFGRDVIPALADA
ncbi:MAG: LLM class F420-dependent oxidoreductase [Proteobacteria bacterium]|nr:MAG: LLM class F420-dependent oxidoreductase [Pseudomonadota bacterium]